MFNLSEYRRKPNCLADRLCWAALVDYGIILNKTGTFMKTVEVMGYDLEGAQDGAIDLICARLNNVLRRYGSGWAFYYDVERTETVAYPKSNFPEPISGLIDEERRYLFEESGCFFESKIYFTLVWLPPTTGSEQLQQFFFNHNTNQEGYATKVLKDFKQKSQKLLAMLSAGFLSIRELDSAETLTYLHSIVSTKKHSVKVPDRPVYLDYLLIDQPLVGGFNPKLGNKYIQILTIRDFPSTSVADLLGSLNNMDLEFRWTTRWIALDKEVGTKALNTAKKKWFAKRLDIMDLIGQALQVDLSSRKTQSSDAEDKEYEIDDLIKAVTTDQISCGYYTSTIIVMDQDLQICKQKIAKIESIINNKGFNCIIEDKNSVDAWFGSLPGHTYANVRLPMLTSANLAHLLPISSAWAGPTHNQHLQKTCAEGAPLFIAQTLGNTPFRAVFHHAGSGHTLIFGPTGQGKSTFMLLSALQFLRYPKAQVIIFDKSFSAKVATHAVQGQWYGFLTDYTDKNMALQPLANIDNKEERIWAMEWLIALLTNFKFVITPERRNKIWDGLTTMSGLSSKCKTLTNLKYHIMDKEIRDAMAPITKGGEYALLLDGDTDLNLNSHWICFEMEEIMNSAKEILVPVLSCIFRKTKKMYTGVPTLVIFDEAWAYLEDQYFQKEIRKSLKEERKNNVSIWLATQSISDLESKEISDTLKDNCSNRLFLPNPKLSDPKIWKQYEQLGLNDTKIDIIRSAESCKHYFFDSPAGSRLIDLAMGPISMAFTAHNGKAAAEKSHAILQRSGAANFAKQWLQTHKLPEAANLLNRTTIADLSYAE